MMLRRKLMAFVLLCMVGISVQAQEKKNAGEIYMEKNLNGMKVTAGVTFVDKQKDKLLKKNDTIQQGNTVIINVLWDHDVHEFSAFEKVIIDSVYTPTAKEIERGRYKCEVVPRKTTTYRVAGFRKMNGEKKTLWEWRIVVVNRKGEIIN